MPVRRGRGREHDDAIGARIACRDLRVSGDDDLQPARPIRSEPCRSSSARLAVGVIVSAEHNEAAAHRYHPQSGCGRVGIPELWPLAPGHAIRRGEDHGNRRAAMDGHALAHRHEAGGAGCHRVELDPVEECRRGLRELRPALSIAAEPHAHRVHRVAAEDTASTLGIQSAAADHEQPPGTLTTNWAVASWKVGFAASTWAQLAPSADHQVTRLGPDPWLPTRTYPPPMDAPAITDASVGSRMRRRPDALPASGSAMSDRAWLMARLAARAVRRGRHAGDVDVTVDGEGASRRVPDPHAQVVVVRGKRRLLVDLRRCSRCPHLRQQRSRVATGREDEDERRSSVSSSGDSPMRGR